MKGRRGGESETEDRLEREQTLYGAGGKPPEADEDSGDEWSEQVGPEEAGERKPNVSWRERRHPESPVRPDTRAVVGQYAAGPPATTYNSSDTTVSETIGGITARRIRVLRGGLT